MTFDSVAFYVTINIFFHVPINIFVPKIFQIRLLETTKGVHKFINISISKRLSMAQPPLTDNLATCLNVNGRNRGKHFVTSRG